KAHHLDDDDSDADDDEDDVMKGVDIGNFGDESYQGPPAEGFDDSQGAGVAFFKSAVAATGPTDFGFMLQGQNKDFAAGFAAFQGQSSQSNQMAQSQPAPVTPIPSPRPAPILKEASPLPEAKRGRFEEDAYVGQPPQPPLRPTPRPFGVVPGEERGEQAMNPAVIRSDPFFWLRNDDHQNEEVQTLLRDEDAHCAGSLAGLQGLREQLYAEMKSHTQEADLDIPTLYPGGFAYYGRSFMDKPYRLHYRARLASADTGTGTSSSSSAVPGDVMARAAVAGMQLVAEELLLDENQLVSPGQDGQQRPFLSVCGPDPSADHSLLAYGEDFEGSDSYAIHFRDAASGQNCAMHLKQTDGSIQWDAAGHAGIYYIGHDPEYRGFVVRRHVIGTCQTQDQVVFEERNKQFSVSMCKSSDSRFLIVQSASSETSESHFLDLQNPSVGLVCVCPRQYGHRYDVDTCLDQVYILTNKDGAKNLKICSTPLSSIPCPGPQAWLDV
ncbi:unnamed protein product, partial [Polarella glacialis]